MQRYEQIVRIFKKETEKAGVILEERESKSTDSIYFKIYHNQESLLFRVSDHKTKSDLTTLRVDHKISDETIKKFILNRIKGVKQRSLDSFFNFR